MRRAFIQLTCFAALTWIGAALAATAGPLDPPPDRGRGQALDQRDYADELPRIPPVEPADALDTFRLQSGYRIELMAAEPLVTDPIAMAWDAEGRLFIVEMRGYSEDREDRLGRIRLLEDFDGDGRPDRAAVFADDLAWPTAVICWDGGVFIGAAPDILYLKDTDGDGRADLRRTVFTGFGQSNVQGLLNSFRWSLDNRIIGAAGTADGRVRRADDGDAEPIDLRGRDFAFDPRTLEIEPVSGGAQHGACFDDWGRRFVCSNSDHLQMVMFEQRYARRHSHLPAPGPRLSIAADGPQAEVFRISPVEPWRIVRTRLRVAGEVPGPIEGGGRPAGYFTGSTGVTIIRGDGFGPKLRGAAIIGDVGSNIVHRKRLGPDGVALIGRRIDPQSELLASTDIWFRPVQFANGPDGALWIADMYREVIEHPDSLPPVIKRHLDLTSGRDRGRLYRIVPDPPSADEPRPAASHRIGTDAPTGKLVELLAHPNAWHRETAARLLYERQDRDAIGPLRHTAAESTSPLGRLHALYALDGLDALRADDLLIALRDVHPRIREHAVRLAERIDRPQRQRHGIASRLLEMTEDTDLRVRYQLAFTLGEIDHPDQYQALARLLATDGADRWVRFAALSSLAEGAHRILALLTDEPDFLTAPHAAEVLRPLASVIAAAGPGAPGLAIAAEALPSLADDHPPLAVALLHGLADGAGATGPGAPGLRRLLSEHSGEPAARALDRLIRRAADTAHDESAEPEARARAVETLTLAPFDEVRRPLRDLLDPRRPPPVQRAALDALARFDDPAIADILIAALSASGGLTPALRSAAVEHLLRRPARTAALLDAVESAMLSPAALSQDQVNRLLQHATDPIRRRARGLLADRAASPRQQVIDRYRTDLAGLTGDPQSGRTVFTTHCAACHKLEGVGHELGPNLAAFAPRGAEALLLNVLDPNREVNPQYLDYTVTTTDGRTLSGMIAAESSSALTLSRGAGTEITVSRRDIRSIRSADRSIMTEGLELAIDPEAMADLIAYLTSFATTQQP